MSIPTDGMSSAGEQDTSTARPRLYKGTFCPRIDQSNLSSQRNEHFVECSCNELYSVWLGTEEEGKAGRGRHDSGTGSVTCGHTK